MFGNYNIEDGIYKMSMQNVIRKDFALQSGGTVSFNGNPRQANLNVQAVYTVNSASLNDLVADASSTRGNVRVNCLLNLSGNLTSPSLKFDLELPTVSDEDRELVRSLTSTEEQMNTQIIYLLVLPFVTAPLFRLIGGLLGVTISAGLQIGRDVFFTYEDQDGSIDTRIIAGLIEMYFR